MAVFPDKIVLKNTADPQNVIESLIGSGGTDEIVPGEIVVGRESGKVKLYSLDSAGAVQVIGGDQLSIDDLTDVDTITTPPSNGDGLIWDGTNWVPGTPVSSIDDLTDVDTTTNPPALGNTLVWDNSNWVPGQGGGGAGAVPGTIVQKTETQTAVSGAATFSDIGASGLLVSVASDLNAWIVLYTTAADRTADAARAYGEDPALGNGVLAEFYVTAGGTVLASPGTSYFNNDTVSADAIYAAVRDQSGGNVNAQVTIKAYVNQNFAGTGTNRVSDSGTAASGALELTGLGQSGRLCTVTSSLDAWIVFYGSAADRTADSGRSFGADPAPGSGVQAEFYITAGSTILATPAPSYFNNDTSPDDIMYLATRDIGGNNVNPLVTVTAYAETNYTGVSGGVFGSG